MSLINNPVNLADMAKNVINNSSIPVIDSEALLNDFLEYLENAIYLDDNIVIDKTLDKKGFIYRDENHTFVYLFEYEKKVSWFKLVGESLYQFNSEKYGGTIEKEYITTERKGVFVTQYSREIHFLDKAFIDSLLDNDKLEIAFNKAMENLITEPKRVTELDWYEMLEVLPPCNWHHVGGFEVFYMSEMTSGTITSWYAKRGNEHYQFSDHCYLNDDQLIKKLGGL